jgi:hypothetical protein
VNPLQQTLRCQFSQIAADCIFREPKFLAQFFCNDLTISAENIKDVLLAMAGEHIATIAHFRDGCTEIHAVAR